MTATVRPNWRLSPVRLMAAPLSFVTLRFVVHGVSAACRRVLPPRVLCVYLPTYDTV